MIANFHETLTKIKLTPKIPDFCLLSPIIKPQSGLQRIEDALKILLQKMTIRGRKKQECAGITI